WKLTPCLTSRERWQESSPSLIVLRRGIFFPLRSIHIHRPIFCAQQSAESCRASLRFGPIQQFFRHRISLSVDIHSERFDRVSIPLLLHFFHFHLFDHRQRKDD